MKRIIIFPLVFVSIMLLPFLLRASDDNIIIHFAHGGSLNHPYHVGAVKFAELVQKKTNGKLIIKVHPNGKLASEGGAGEGVRLGTIDMAVIATAGMLTQWLPEIQVFDMPYLFRDRHHAHHVLDGPIGEEIRNKIEQYNVKTLAYWEIGVRHHTNNKRPIVSPDDLKGLKMRVMSSRVCVEASKALGATAIPMAFRELYGAFQKGIVDGQDNPFATIKSMRYYEVQKYLSLTAHAYSPALVIINKEKYEQLPATYRKILASAALETAKYQRKFIEENEATHLKFLESKGMIVSKPKRDIFEASSQVVYEKMKDQIPQELVQRIRRVF